MASNNDDTPLGERCSHCGKVSCECNNSEMSNATGTAGTQQQQKRRKKQDRQENDIEYIPPPWLVNRLQEPFYKEMWKEACFWMESRSLDTVALFDSPVGMLGFINWCRIEEQQTPLSFPES